MGAYGIVAFAAGNCVVVFDFLYDNSALAVTGIEWGTIRIVLADNVLFFVVACRNTIRLSSDAAGYQAQHCS